MMSLPSSEISVFGLQPSFFIRPNNTDWRQNKLLEVAAANFSSQCGFRFGLNGDWRSLLHANSVVVRGLLHRKVGIRPTHLRQRYFVDVSRVPRASEADVIYAYGSFPAHAKRPVVWHDGPTNVSQLARAGVPPIEIDEELRMKADCCKAAKLVAVSTEAAAIEMQRQFPDSIGKVVVLPFILPELTSLSEEEVIEKHGSPGVDVVFVGREARRKGLDLLIEAFASLPHSLRKQVRLTVVSNFRDGPITLPPAGNIHVHREMSYARVQELIRRAHVLAMPSRVESFGLVFVEAFAAGTVPLGPDREPQRSLFLSGRLGALCDLQPESIGSALERLCGDAQARSLMAVAGRAEFDSKYSTLPVLQYYSTAFRKAVQ